MNAAAFQMGGQQEEKGKKGRRVGKKRGRSSFLAVEKKRGGAGPDT
jgi:hypothetical protein